MLQCILNLDSFYNYSPKTKGLLVKIHRDKDAAVNISHNHSAEANNYAGRNRIFPPLRNH